MKLNRLKIWEKLLERGICSDLVFKLTSLFYKSIAYDIICYFMNIYVFHNSIFKYAQLLYGLDFYNFI